MKSPFKLIRSKLRVRLFSIIVLVLIIFIAVINIASKPLLYRTFTGKTYRDMCTIADTVDTLIPDTGSYYIDLYSLAENHNVSFEIEDSQGLLVYKTDGSGSALSSSHFSSSSAGTDYSEMVDSSNSSAAYNYENFEVKKKPATDADYFIYTYKLSFGDTLHIYSPVADVESVVDTAGTVYSAFSGAMVILIAAVFFIISYSFTRPVEEINSVTKRMAALDFSRKCNDYGSDEIGELGRSINTLSDTLDGALLDLKDKNGQLEKDIELRLALDNARKSFISNVSHELKTPIAIITGYAEGLCEGISDDPEVIKEYCRIIKDEGTKMNELVLELLELSKLESKSAPFTPDYFDLGESVSKLLEHLSLQLEQNGITVVNNVPESFECYAQADKLEIVLKNYITNAISHCSGEKKIIIGCETDERVVRITVFNTGSHIDDADLPEIWDSFYRADKAHGRSENRFGLGLSIVKSIMTNHSCSFGAKNVEGGVEFMFEAARSPDYYEENKE